MKLFLVIVFTVFLTACSPLDSSSSLKEQSIRVMSWNILYKGWEKKGDPLWKDRAPGVPKLLKQQQADVISLQEDGRAQVNYITKALPDYTYIQPHSSKGGGLLIRKNKWDILKSGKISIPGKREASWALLKSKQDDQVWMFYNAHFVHRSARNSEELRMIAAKSIADHIAKNAPAKVPVVFTGDFNALNQMRVMRYLSGEENSPVKFVNAFDHIHGADNPLGTWRGQSKDHKGDRIDHILVNKYVKINHAEIIFFDKLTEPYPSDHYPVMASIVATE